MRPVTRSLLLPTRRSLLAGLAVGAGAPLIAACSSGPPAAKTTSLEFGIEADQEINANENGDPSPIVLRVYELKTKNAFEQASFFELLDSDTAKLGADLVSKRELEVKPGEKSSFKRESPTEAKHIGVIAGFRQIEVAQWRSLVDIVPDRDNAFLITVRALAVKIELQRASRNFGLI
ncbi:MULTISPECIES: type VI secretion system lipoprotein TssJ [unclassified Bosea (in: a-proteobacteria)]|uniref:type VI secretion system lipoprotein TssJ n=1 Tax=unclassified Bosea (in: a-proteobacteria) TaxID=2653178 RepID=UPI000F74CD85|nr:MULTISPECIES: type VI secretion system lipoprotein TssJ [unclassified Bosea (in: a-proteobacteria)]AZO78239.1 type VI secretion system-associated lipoprotein [Bosea sp. Tri-49]